MRRIEESIVINRPCSEVFAYLENRANDPAWMLMVQESEWLASGTEDSSGGVSIGRRGRMVMKVQRRPREFIDEVTDYRPGHRIAHRTVTGPFQLNTACICEPESVGCRATVVGEADRLLSGRLGRLLDPFVAFGIRRSFRADLARLKLILEANPAGASNQIA